MTPLLLAVVLLAGEPTRKPEDVDACALVTADEVKAILGALREPPRADTGIQKEKECRYLDGDGQNVTLSVYTAERWGLQKGIVSEMDPKDEPGMGDEAFSVRRGSSTEVYVRKG